MAAKRRGTQPVRRRVSRMETTGTAEALEAYSDTSKRTSLPSQELASKVPSHQAGENVSGRPTIKLPDHMASANGVEGEPTTRICLRVLTALLTRSLFLLYSSLVIWMAMIRTEDNSTVWICALISLSMVIEAALSIVSKAGREGPWFSPCILLFVLSVIPPIWLLKLKARQNEVLVRPAEIGTPNNSTNFYDVSQAHTGRIWLITGEHIETVLHSFIAEILLLVLIVGRWLLPRNRRTTRNHLSQILLANVAIAVDIAEFFKLTNEENVRTSNLAQYLVLSAWSVSLVQFSLVLTISRARKIRNTGADADSKELRRRGGALYFDADICSILLAHALQDVPFICIRLYLLAYRGVGDKASLLLISKNGLIILLQSYRLYVIVSDRYIKRRRIRRLLKNPRQEAATADAKPRSSPQSTAADSRAVLPTIAEGGGSSLLQAIYPADAVRRGSGQPRKRSAIDDDIVVTEVGGHYHLVSGVELPSPNKAL